MPFAYDRDRDAGPFVLGSFSMVMATGIVAAALRRDGLTLPADVVLAVAAAGLVVLAVAASWRVGRQPAAYRAELLRPRRAFAAFTLPAACAVVGMGLATSGLPVAGAVLAVAGVAAWLAMTALIPARMAVSRRARPVLTDVNGTWYLLTVATQSLAVMAAVLLAAGALAVGSAAAVAMTAWLALRSRRRPRYDPSAWMLVFPVGMYATASQQLGTTASLYPVRLVGEIFTWPAAVAWLAVLAAMATARLAPIARQQDAEEQRSASARRGNRRDFRACTPQDRHKR